MARFRLASLKSEVSYWSRTVVRATSGLQTHCQTDGDMLTVQFSDCYVRTVRFGPFHSDRYIRTVRCHQLNSLAIRSYPMNKIWEFGNGRCDACSHTANTRRLVEHSMVGHTARCSTILVCVCAKFAHTHTANKRGNHEPAAANAIPYACLSYGWPSVVHSRAIQNGHSA